MDFKESLNNLRSFATRVGVSLKDLVTYEAMDGYTQELMSFYNTKKQNKQDNTLETTAKEIVPAINESLWRIKAKKIDNSRIKEISEIKQPGIYYSAGQSDKFSDLPSSFNKSGGFVLTVTNLETDDYVQQTIRQYRQSTLYNRYYDKYDTNAFTQWSEVITNDSSLFLGNAGVNKIQHIQDTILKERGKGYTDEITGKLYVCLYNTNATTPTSDFILAGNVDLEMQIQNSPIIITGNYTDFSKSSSIKLFPNKPFLTIVNRGGLNNAVGEFKTFIADESSKSLTEGTLVFDKGAFGRNEYHIQTSETDNYITIIQMP